MHTFKYFQLFFMLLLVAACKEPREQRSNLPSFEELLVEQKGQLVLKLDFGVNFEWLISLEHVSIQGEDYLTFYDRITHTIYLYEVTGGDYIKKIELDKEGPNGIKSLTKFFFHTMDSIFIDSPFGIYLIDSNAKIVTKKSKGAEQRDGFPVLSLDSKIYAFDTDSRLENGEIDMEIRMINRKQNDFERARFNFKSDSIVEEFIETRDLIYNYKDILEEKANIKNAGGLALNIDRYHSSIGEYRYVSTSISDSLYVFKNGDLLKTIYAGDPNVQIANYASYATRRLIERFERGINAHENPKQPPYYKGMFSSPDGRLVYRLLYHGSRPKFIEGEESAVPNSIGATLIIFDLHTNGLSYYSLPVDQIDLEKNQFVSNYGIYFRVKNQQNEDEVRFKFFKVSR